MVTMMKGGNHICLLYFCGSLKRGITLLVCKDGEFCVRRGTACAELTLFSLTVVESDQLVLV